MEFHQTIGWMAKQNHLESILDLRQLAYLKIIIEEIKND